MRTYYTLLLLPFLCISQLASAQLKVATLNGKPVRIINNIPDDSTENIASTSFVNQVIAAMPIPTIHDADETVKGIMQLATATETTDGSLDTKAVHPAGLKAELGKTWKTTGNTGTIATSNFIGTTDAIDLTFRTNNAPRMTLTATGNLGIGKVDPTEALEVAGNALLSGNIIAANTSITSDVRLKKNIKELKNTLETVNKLRPVSYEKKNSIEATKYTIKEVGFIAQEVRKVLPELVSEMNDADKTLTVNYTAIIPILTKAIQEQYQQIKEQQEVIKAQQAQIDAILKKINSWKLDR